MKSDPVQIYIQLVQAWDPRSEAVRRLLVQPDSLSVTPGTEIQWVAVDSRNGEEEEVEWEVTFKEQTPIDGGESKVKGKGKGPARPMKHVGQRTPYAYSVSLKGPDGKVYDLDPEIIIDPTPVRG